MSNESDLSYLSIPDGAQGTAQIAISLVGRMLDAAGQTHTGNLFTVNVFDGALKRTTRELTTGPSPDGTSKVKEIVISRDGASEPNSIQIDTTRTDRNGCKSAAGIKYTRAEGYGYYQTPPVTNGRDETRARAGIRYVRETVMEIGRTYGLKPLKRRLTPTVHNPLRPPDTQPRGTITMNLL